MTDSTQDEWDALSRMIDRQKEAFARPTGSWWERFVPGVCLHRRIRCVHGDEIVMRRGRRQVCMICGRSLPGALPVICFFTGGIHDQYR